MTPLAGIKIIELARILAGPWCGQLLADLGAEVIKIERPKNQGQRTGPLGGGAVGGDDTRGWGPPFVHGPDGTDLGAAYYHSANRGKSGRSIDITTAQGQAAVRDMVRNADVVIENYKVGGLAKYGLDHISLSAINPRLITCSITGFGQTGPYKDRAGYDFIIQAMGGAMSLTGEPGGPPQKSGVAYADIFTGLYSAVAILAALRTTAQTGIGAHIDMALLDCQVAVLANQAANYFATGVSPHRMGNGHANLVPYQSFACGDGDLIIAVGNDAQFARLCAVLGLADLADNPDYATNAARLANRGRLIAHVSGKIVHWNKAALYDALETAGIPAGPINTLADVFADPQVIARGLQFRPDGAAIDGLASPIRINGIQMVATGGAPELG